jgi:L-Ala-D/L-Glu epimerase
VEILIQDWILPLRHAWSITHGTTSVRHNLLVTLRDGALEGYGEAAGSLAYAEARPEVMRAALATVPRALWAAPFSTPERLWDEMLPYLGGNRFALCAVDEAAHDLWAKKQHQPLWQLWGGNPEHLPLTNYTIGLDTPERMIEKLREFGDWPLFKIKVAQEDPVGRVRALRAETAARFRLDANTAWTLDEALRYGPEMAALGVEFIEQPLRVDDAAHMITLKAQSPLPLIADESCQTESDVERCAAGFHGINIKLSKAGGLTPARRMIQRARELGLRVMSGCMIESSVGISAQAQLAPWLDDIDLDGAVLLARDPARGITIDRGRLQLNTTPGTGARLDLVT